MPNEDLPPVDADGGLPDAVNENLETISEFYERHKHEISPTQTLIERVALFFGRPGYLIGIVVFAVLWIGANVFAELMGWEVFDEPAFFWLQGIFTYSGHPVACAAALENIRILEEEGLVERVAHDTGPYLQERFRSLAAHPLVGTADSLGFVAGLSLVRRKAARVHDQVKFDPALDVGMYAARTCSKTASSCARWATA